MTFLKTAARSLLACLVATCVALPAAADEHAAEPERFDGLVPVKDARVAMAYVNPEADFSVFHRVAIVDPYVAFRANWQRDQNRSRTTNVRASDMDRIKTDVAHEFRQVFIERLEAGGYDVTTETGDDVLVLRPAIVDLDVTAPDLQSAGRSRTYTATNGAATLYIELIDAHSGDLLGRAADRQVARHRGASMSWNNRVVNRSEARRIFGRWADKLVEFLDTHYGVKGKAGDAG